MKIILILFLTLISLQSYGGIIKKVMPKVKITDALSTRFYNINSFCLSADETILKGSIPFCYESINQGRRGKICVDGGGIQNIEIPNSYSYRVGDPRGSEYARFSFKRMIEVKVIDSDPRGADVEIERYQIELETCEN